MSLHLLVTRLVNLVRGGSKVDYSQSHFQTGEEEPGGACRTFERISVDGVAPVYCLFRPTRSASSRTLMILL